MKKSSYLCWLATNAASVTRHQAVLLNLNRIVRALFCLGFLAAVWTPSLQAQTDKSVDGVTVKNETVYAMHGAQLDALTDNLKLPCDVEVNTNGYFKVGNGHERKLEEGQVLRSDGWLLNQDGSLWPVHDYATMKAGKVIVVRDGQAETVTKTMTFPNHLSISPDGSCIYPNGGNARLADGQLFQLDGSSVPSKDTVTLKSGKVVVQKSGTLITLAPGQIMGMNDGSRVQGDGTIKNRDGTTTQLHEGQTVLVDGAAAAH